MNEAEFQTHILQKVKEAFPLLPSDIQLERYLKLQLGHHKVIIDGKENDANETKGRFDVLVKHHGIPLLLIELKAPGIPITHSDELQALSYARLHTPIAPIYMVTNGTTTICKRTYDCTEINLTEEGATLEKILQSANKIAAIDTEDAIRTLLSVSKDTWIPLLEEWSNEEISSLSGNLRDLSAPLTESFSIPRELSKKISEIPDLNKQIIVVHGRPHCGITNSLTQIYNFTKDLLSVFIDSRRHADILQSLANRLSRKLSFGISKDDVRKWLNSNRGLSGILFICDGIPSEGVNEIIDYARSGLCGFILGVDSETYRCITYDGKASRYNIALAPNLVFEQEQLSVDEYSHAKDIISKTFSTEIMPGDIYVPELKWPRLLRILSAIIPEDIALRKTDVLEEKLVMPAILHHSILKSMSAKLVKSHQIKYDLQRLAKAYLNQYTASGDLTAIKRNALRGTYSLLPEILENDLGEPRILRLCTLGFLTWSDDPIIGPVLVIKNEEILAYFISLQWQKDMISMTDIDVVKSEIPKIINICHFVPMSEIALAHALAEISQTSQDATSLIANFLINSKPTESILSAGSMIDIVSLSDTAPIQLEEGENRKIRGNLIPWLAMSYLLVEEMAKDEQGIARNFDIFAIICQYDDFLWQPRPSDIDSIIPFKFHDMPDGSSIPCYHMGIVEPVQQALYTIASRYPLHFQSFAKWAYEEGNTHIKWRILSVAMLLASSTNEEISHSAEIIIQNLSDDFNDCNDSNDENFASPLIVGSSLTNPFHIDFGCAKTI